MTNLLVKTAVVSANAKLYYRVSQISLNEISHNRNIVFASQSHSRKKSKTAKKDPSKGRRTRKILRDDRFDSGHGRKTSNKK